MEIAFISADRLRVELEKKQGKFSSGVIGVFIRNKGQYIATMLVGNNIALVIYGIYFAKLIEPYIRQYIDSDSTILIIQTLISTLLILVTAEFLPKTIFRENSNSLLNVLAFPVFIFYVILYPIAKFTVIVSNSALKHLFKINTNDANSKVVFGKIDLNNFLSQENESNMNDEDVDSEVKIFRNALDFPDVKVRECMVPRNEIIAIEQNESIDEIKKMFIETGFSKILVFKNSIDNIVGFVHILDVYKKVKIIKSAMHKIIVVPESMLAETLFNKLIKKHNSIALVVDEFGGTSGMLTLEDIIEEIFGEIEDEHDTIELEEERISENEFVFSGRLEIDYINEKYKINLPESSDYETLAGFIFFLHEQIPEQGEIIKTANFKFEILKTKAPKIETVKLIIKS